MAKEDSRIGVFVCHCGLNINGVVDCPALTSYASSLPGVVHSIDLMFACSDDGQESIKRAIRDHALNGVVVASCTPRTHEPVFRSCVAAAGLNPYLYDHVNIREHVSWCHMAEKQGATAKAKHLVAMSVERTRMLEPLDRQMVPVIRKSAVIGGGVAGISAALDLANAGFETYLIEKRPTVGGQMALLDKVFPQNDCAICILGPIMSAVGRHPNIHLMSYSEVENVKGYVGNFTLRVRKKSRYVDTDKCNACKECEPVCPSRITNEYESGLTERKAIHIPFPQATPNAYTITKRGHARCRIACPAHVNTQGFIALMREGKNDLALKMVRESIPLPGSLGRVCTSPCEEQCERSTVDEGVNIRNLHRWLADNETTKAEPVASRPEGKARVAVVGAGPAGIACGERLARLGIPVTIFEARKEAGGLLRWGIPDYRLPKDILRKEISDVQELGVRIDLGRRITGCTKLFEEGFEAVYLATGACATAKLGIDGEDAEGVYSALEFLERVNGSEEVVVGRNVAVIGGGNAAIDAARVAKRLGAKKVKILYRRARNEMPAIPQEIQDAEDEGVELILQAAPIELVVSEGKVESVKCLRTKLGELDASGRRRPVPVEGSEFVVKAETVITAVGQVIGAEGPHSELNVNSWGAPNVDPVTFETSREGVFAGGDLVTGAGVVVEAVAAGHEAAESIYRYLNGRDLREGRSPEWKTIPSELIDKSGIEMIPRYTTKRASRAKRTASFKEVDMGFDQETAIQEAARCIGCGVCSECMECVRVCTRNAIDHSMKDEIVDINVGTVILATGLSLYDPSGTREYGFGAFDNVITNAQFERMTNAAGPTHGKIVRPSDKTPPKSIAFVQCVGSRDRRIDRDYCCYYGCENSLKQATQVKEKYPETEVVVFAMDIRTHGLGYEGLYRRARSLGVTVIKSRPSEIEQDPVTKSLKILAEDLYTDELLQITFDLVVLACAILPAKETPEIAKLFNVSLGGYGFLTEAHPKLRPVDSFREGVFLAGACLGPMDIPKAVAYGKAAAAGAQTLMAPAQFHVEPVYAEIDTELCIGCDLCSEMCPYGAIEGSKKERRVLSELCQGCGTCAAGCPRNAIDMLHYRRDQLIPQIRAASSETEEVFS